MRKTTNYNLNQWEADDVVRREDFNADNAKIDAAIKAASDASPEIVFGTYTGDGTANRVISLGRKPKAVYVQPRTGNGGGGGNYDGGLASQEYPLLYNGRDTIVRLTDDGFMVSYQYISNSSYIYTNATNVIHYYAALF